MECRHGLAMRFLSTCPSVSLSVKHVHCDKMEENLLSEILCQPAQTFYLSDIIIKVEKDWRGIR